MTTTPDVPVSRLHTWLHPAILSAAALSVASGYAQFGVFTALADVAREFSPTVPAAEVAGVAAELGLSGTTLGIGLGIVRLAALGGLPLAAMADRVGRRRMLLLASGIGLGLTAISAGAPFYWAFIALFATARPMLSATNALGSVIAAEETTSRHRAKAVALITASYGFGAGIPAAVRALDERLLDGALGFRGMFALAVVPLLLLPLLARKIEEPVRFERLRQTGDENRMALGAVPLPLRGRLALLIALTMAATFAATPITGYVFAYSEGVLGVSSSFTFAVVISAGLLGLAGLLLGRWGADRIGRRMTCAVMHVVAGVAGIFTYSGGLPVAVGGYLAGILAASAYAPAAGALTAEIFPTAERATAAGWVTAASATGAVMGLVAFGVLADTFAGFSTAAIIVTIPVIVTSPFYLFLPETAGLELEESAPEVV